MLERLIRIDEQLFLWLNALHCKSLDPVMWAISSKYLWIPLYVFILYLIIKRYRWQSVVIVISIALLIILSDQISGWLKDSLMRLRPTHNPKIQSVIHTLYNYRGGSYGFVSSHAANSFALATFSSLLFKGVYKNFHWWIFLWAVLVSYSRIYLGVHYPADLLGGAVLGGLLACFCYLLVIRLMRSICKEDSKLK